MGCFVNLEIRLANREYLKLGNLGSPGLQNGQLLLVSGKCRGTEVNTSPSNMSIQGIDVYSLGFFFF